MNRVRIYFTALCIFSLFTLSCKNTWICKKSASPSDFQITSVTIGSGRTELEIPKTSFTKDEKIFISYDAKNIISMRDGAGEYFWIRQDIMVQDSKNRISAMEPGVINIKDEIANKPEKFINELSVADIMKAGPGRYNITILVTDLIGLQTAKTRIPITVK